MTAPARIGLFVAGLAVIFGAAFGIGAAIGPWDLDTAPSHSEHPVTTHSDTTVQENHGEH